MQQWPFAGMSVMMDGERLICGAVQFWTAAETADVQTALPTSSPSIHLLHKTALEVWGMSPYYHSQVWYVQQPTSNLCFLLTKVSAVLLFEPDNIHGTTTCDKKRWLLKNLSLLYTKKYIIDRRGYTCALPLQRAKHCLWYTAAETKQQSLPGRTTRIKSACIKS